jgi:hypothetical protein
VVIGLVDGTNFIFFIFDIQRIIMQISSIRIDYKRKIDIACVRINPIVG